MTYQQTVNLIRDTAVAVNPTGTFLHGLVSDACNAYNEPLPHIVLYPFDENGDAANLSITQSELLISFKGQDTLETTPQQREAVIAEMDVLCRRFLQELTNNPDVKIDRFNKQPQYRTLAGTLTGYALRLNITSHSSPC